MNFPTPLLNDNQGSIDWIESGCKPTKKLRHENLSELGIYEARLYNEVDIYWTPGPSNLADIFTKEDKDVAHFELIRDQMVMPRESFRLPIKAKSWGVLERRLDDHNYDSLTQLTKRKEKIEKKLTTLIKVGEGTQNDMNEVSNTNTENIIDNDNNQSNESTYSDEEKITTTSKPIYPSYKDACMNQGKHDITCDRHDMTYGRNNHRVRPPATSE